MIRFELIDPSRLIGMDLAKTIRRGLKSQSEKMRDYELGRILDRTPYLTGALQADETGTFNKDPDDPELIHMFVTDKNQLEEWNKAYAKFVEGPDIGETGMWATDIWEASNGTFTGFHMFAAAEEDDTAGLLALLWNGLDQGIDDIVNGKGYRL